jgi:hypothetical protein
LGTEVVAVLLLEDQNAPSRLDELMCRHEPGQTRSNDDCLRLVHVFVSFARPTPLASGAYYANDVA